LTVFILGLHERKLVDLQKLKISQEAETKMLEDGFVEGGPRGECGRDGGLHATNAVLVR
jgi:hypothetical protein